MSTIDPAWGIAAAILVMAAVTYPMRAGGYWLMGHIPLTPWVRRLLEALPGTVIVATVLPLLLREGLPAALAMAVAIGAMIVRRNDFLALAAGIAAVAAVRALAG
jgi:uncharacterized membrane protein